MEVSNKDIYNHVTIGIILLFLVIILTSVTTISEIVELKDKNNSNELSFKDNISNPNNIEYLEEVKFNKVTNDLQMDFCYRYWDTLDDESKEWFKQQLK